MKDKRLAKIKGLPVQETSDISAEPVKGNRPNITISNDEQLEENAFAKERINS